MDNGEHTSERELQGVANSNRAMDLNPEDIENVSILKGAAATALYGIEGARGVVLITTKSGSSGGLKVDVGTNITFSEVTNIVGLSNNYIQGSNGVWQGPETGQSGSWGPHKDDVFYDGSDYKWDNNGRLTTTSGSPFVPYDNVGNLFETGVRQNHNFAVSGGNDVSDFRFSYGNLGDKGITPKNEYNRHTLGLKVGSSLFDDKLDVKFGANYVRSTATRIQQGSNLSGIMLGLLRTPISFDNTNGFINAADEPLSYQFPDATQRNYRGGGGYDNPFWVVNNAPFTDKVNRFYGNVNIAYEVSPWLNFRGVLGLDTYADNRIQRFEIGSRNVAGGQVIEDNYNYAHTDFYFSVSGGGDILPKLSVSYNVGLNLYDEKLKQSYETLICRISFCSHNLLNDAIKIKHHEHVTFRPLECDLFRIINDLL